MPRADSSHAVTRWLNMPALTFTLVLLAFAVPAIIVSRSWMAGDIWWVLKNGEVLVTRGTLGSSDPFTFAPHSGSSINAQWLGHLLYYATYRALGAQGVIGVTVAATMGMLGFLFAISHKRTRSVVAAALATLATVPVVMWTLNPRTQVFAFVLFAATYWLLTSVRRGLPALVALTAIEVLWANIHGSFFVAPVLTALVMCGDVYTSLRIGGVTSVMRNPRVRFLSVLATAQALATLVTPYGLELHIYAARLMSNSVIRSYVTEWTPTNVHQATGAAFFVSGAMTIALASRAKRGIGLRDALLLVVFGALALQAVRNVIWWGLVSAPIVAVGISQLSLPQRIAHLGRRPGTVRQNLLRAGLVALVVVAFSPVMRSSNPLLQRLTPLSSADLLPPGYPVAAAEYLLTASLPPRVYADQPWGAYLDWKLWPRYEMFVDASMETHPAEVWMDVIAISNAVESWQDKLDHYAVDVLFLNPERQPDLVRAADRSDKWRRAFTDEFSVVFIRTSGEEADA